MKNSWVVKRSRLFCGRGLLEKNAEKEKSSVRKHGEESGLEIHAQGQSCRINRETSAPPGVEAKPSTRFLRGSSSSGDDCFRLEFRSADYAPKGCFSEVSDAGSGALDLRNAGFDREPCSGSRRATRSQDIIDNLEISSIGFRSNIAQNVTTFPIEEFGARVAGKKLVESICF